MDKDKLKQPLHISTDQRGVCRLTLNRPQCANALDGELVKALSAALSEISDDEQVRVLVLSGAGSAFCSGADLQWMQQMAAADTATNQADARALGSLLEQLVALPKPVLARVNGAAFGGALGLIAACDVAIASNTARFAFSEVRLGLVPAVIAPLVVAAIGLRQARRWFLSGEHFDAEQALAMGLLHQQVVPDQLDELVEQQLQQLLLGGPQAQGQLKALFGEWLRNNPPNAQQCARLLAQIRCSSEAKQGLAAFFDKTPPGWLP